MTTLLLFVALILTIVELARGGVRSPLCWAVLLVILVLILPGLPLR